MSTRHRMAIVVLLCGLGSALSGVARAQDAAPDPAAQLKSLKQYGAIHKACDGWSDGCALCARRADGTLGCSRLGVDCQIAAIECTQRARDPKTGKTPPPE